MTPPKRKRRKPPQVNPYLFPFLMFLFGSWCFYDGWLTTDPDMLEHATFNKVASAIMLPWAVWDFFNERKKGRKAKEAREAKRAAQADSPENAEPPRAEEG